MTTRYTEQQPSVEIAFAASRQKFEEVVRWLGDSEAERLDHGDVESHLSERSRTLLRQLFQDHLDLRATREEKLESVQGADEVARGQRREGETKNLRTVFGNVVVRRISYEAPGVSSLRPLDAALNLPLDVYSHGVARRISEDAIKMSFEGAMDDLERTAGVHVPKRQAEALTRKAAADFDAFYEGRAVNAPQESEDLMVLSTDGKGVVVRHADLRDATRKKAEQEATSKRKKRLGPGEKRNRKRMGTVAAVYSVGRNIRTPEEVMGLAKLPDDVTRLPARPKPTDKRVWASLARGPDAVMDDVFREAERRDPERQRSWVFLVDGDLEQLRRVLDFSELYRVQPVVICDFVHVLEYLWTAAHCFHLVGSDEAEEWVIERALDILRGKSSDVAAGMRRSATLRKIEKSKRKGVDDCARYLLNHKPFLRYDEYLAAGYPIASGVIEGACRHLVNDRLQITGARWSVNGAEAILRSMLQKASG
jgi:hypothetical protein